MTRASTSSAGVAEYWIVDLDARIVERWRPEDARPEIQDETLEWSLPGGAAGMLDISAFFRSIFEEDRWRIRSLRPGAAGAPRRSP